MKTSALTVSSAMYNISNTVSLFGVFAFMVILTNCHPINVPGSVTRTKVTNFQFFERIANPCGIHPAVISRSVSNSVTSTRNPPSVATLNDASNDKAAYYEMMVDLLQITLNKIHALELAAPDLPECNGISLDSLPALPSLKNLNEADTLKEVYQSGIFLVTHFHLMFLDRELTPGGDNNVPDDQVQNSVPSWRFLRCGNESVTGFPNALSDVIGELEMLVCALVSSSTEEQRTGFREPLNRLEETTMFRYHTSCTLLETRDCLVVREAKQALNIMREKFFALKELAVAGSEEFSNAL